MAATAVDTARKEPERFEAFSFDELFKRNKANLDIFWHKDEILEESANLSPPAVITAEIAEDLVARDRFARIAASLLPGPR